jgi:hypothetical protein
MIEIVLRIWRVLGPPAYLIREYQFDLGGHFCKEHAGNLILDAHDQQLAV